MSGAYLAFLLLRPTISACFDNAILFFMISLFLPSFLQTAMKMPQMLSLQHKKRIKLLKNCF
jgi:hypothetical protein